MGVPAKLLIVFIFGSFFYEPSEAAVVAHETDYVTPAEPVKVLRSTMIPCYGRNQSGLGRRANMSYIEGERCGPPLQQGEARRLDRPEQETEDPGQPFKKRAL